MAHDNSSLDPDDSFFSYSDNTPEEPDGMWFSRDFDNMEAPDEGGFVDSTPDDSDISFSQQKSGSSSKYMPRPMPSLQQRFSHRITAPLSYSQKQLLNMASNRPIPNRQTMVSNDKGLLGRLNSLDPNRIIPYQNLANRNAEASGDVQWINPKDAKIDSSMQESVRKKNSGNMTSRDSNGKVVFSGFADNKTGFTRDSGKRSIGSLMTTLENADKVAKKNGRKTRDWTEAVDDFGRPVLRSVDESGRMVDIATALVNGKTHVFYGTANETNQNLVAPAPIFKGSPDHMNPRNSKFRVAGIRSTADNLFSIVSNPTNSRNFINDTDAQTGEVTVTGGLIPINFGEINSQRLNQNLISIPNKYDYNPEGRGKKPEATYDFPSMVAVQQTAEIDKAFADSDNGVDGPRFLTANRKTGGGYLKNPGSFVPAFAPMRVERKAVINPEIYDRNNFGFGGDIYNAVKIGRYNSDGTERDARTDTTANAKGYKHIDLTGGGRGKGDDLYDLRTQSFRRKIRSGASFEGRNFYDEGTAVRSVRLMGRHAFTEGGGLAINPNLYTTSYATRVERGKSLQATQYRPGDVFHNPRKRTTAGVSNSRNFSVPRGGTIGDTSIPLNNVDFGMIIDQREILGKTENSSPYGLQTSVMTMKKADSQEWKNFNSKTQTQIASADSKFSRSVHEAVGAQLGEVDFISPFADPGVRMAGQSINMWLQQPDAEFQDSAEYSVGETTTRVLRDFINQTNELGISPQDALGSIRLTKDGDNDNNLAMYGDLYDQYRGMKALYSHGDNSDYRSAVDNLYNRKARLEGSFSDATFGNFIDMQTSHIQSLFSSGVKFNPDDEKNLTLAEKTEAHINQFNWRLGLKSGSQMYRNEREVQEATERRDALVSLQKNAEAISQFGSRIKFMSSLVDKDGNFNEKNIGILRDSINNNRASGISFGLNEFTGSGGKRHHSADIMADAAQKYIDRHSVDVHVQGVQLSDEYLRDSYYKQLRSKNESKDLTSEQVHAKTMEQFDFEGYMADTKNFTSAKFTPNTNPDLQGKGTWEVSYMDKAFYGVEAGNFVQSASSGMATINAEQLGNMRVSQPKAYEEFMALRKANPTQVDEDLATLSGNRPSGPVHEFQPEVFSQIDKAVRDAMDPNKTLSSLYSFISETSESNDEETVRENARARATLLNDDLERSIRKEVMERYDIFAEGLPVNSGKDAPPIQAGLAARFSNDDSKLMDSMYGNLYKISNGVEISNSSVPDMYRSSFQAMNSLSKQRKSASVSLAVHGGPVSAFNGLPHNVVVVNRDDYEANVRENYRNQFNGYVPDEISKRQSEAIEKQVAYLEGKDSSIILRINSAYDKNAERIAKAKKAAIKRAKKSGASEESIESISSDYDASAKPFLDNKNQKEAEILEKRRKKIERFILESKKNDEKAIRKAQITKREEFISDIMKRFDEGQAGAIMTMFPQSDRNKSFVGVNAVSPEFLKKTYGDRFESLLVPDGGTVASPELIARMDKDADGDKINIIPTSMAFQELNKTDIYSGAMQSPSGEWWSYIKKSLINSADYAQSVQEGHSKQKGKSLYNIASGGSESGESQQQMGFEFSGAVRTLTMASDYQSSDSDETVAAWIRKYAGIQGQAVYQAALDMSPSESPAWYKVRDYLHNPTIDAPLIDADGNEIPHSDRIVSDKPSVDKIFSLIHANMHHKSDPQEDREYFLGTRETASGGLGAPSMVSVSAGLLANRNLKPEAFKEQFSRIKSFLIDEYEKYDPNRESPTTVTQSKAMSDEQLANVYTAEEKEDLVRRFLSVYNGRPVHESVPIEKAASKYVDSNNSVYSTAINSVKNDGAGQYNMSYPLSISRKLTQLFKGNQPKNPKDTIYNLFDRANKSFNGAEVLPVYKELGEFFASVASTPIEAKPRGGLNRALDTINISRDLFDAQAIVDGGLKDILAVTGELGAEHVKIEDGGISEVNQVPEFAMEMGSSELEENADIIVNSPTVITRDEFGNIGTSTDPLVVQNAINNPNVPQHASGKKSNRLSHGRNVEPSGFITRDDDFIKKILSRYEDKGPISVRKGTAGFIEETKFRSGVGGPGALKNPNYRARVDERANNSTYETLASSIRETSDDGEDLSIYSTNAGRATAILTKRYGLSKEDAADIFLAMDTSSTTSEKSRRRMYGELGLMGFDTKDDGSNTAPPAGFPTIPSIETSPAPFNSEAITHISEARFKEGYIRNRNILRTFQQMNAENPDREISVEEMKAYQRAHVGMQSLIGQASMSQRAIREYYGDSAIGEESAAMLSASGNFAQQVLDESYNDQSLILAAKGFTSGDNFQNAIAGETVFGAMMKDDKLDANKLIGQISAFNDATDRSIPTNQEYLAMAPEARRQALARVSRLNKAHRNISNGSLVLEQAGNIEDAEKFAQAYSSSGVEANLNQFDSDAATQLISYAESLPNSSSVGNVNFTSANAERFATSSKTLTDIFRANTNDNGEIDIRTMSDANFNKLRRSYETAHRLGKVGSTWMEQNPGVENAAIDSVRANLTANSDVFTAVESLVNTPEYKARVARMDSQNDELKPLTTASKDRFESESKELSDILSFVQESGGLSGFKPEAIRKIGDLADSISSIQTRAQEYYTSPGSINSESTSSVANADTELILKQANAIKNTQEYKDAVRSQYLQSQKSTPKGSNWTDANFEGVAEAIGPVTDQLQKFSAAVSEIGSITKMTTDDQNYYYKQLKAGANVYKQVSDEIEGIRSTLASGGEVSDKEMKLLSDAGDESTAIGRHMKVYGDNKDKIESSMTAHEINRTLRGEPEDSEQKQLRIWQGLGKSGVSGQIQRNSQGFKELIKEEGGLDVGGFKIGNEKALGAISAGMRAMNKIQSAMFATAMFNHTVGAPMQGAVDAYQTRQSITDSALMRSGVLTREDLMNSSHGERIMRGIRSEDFTAKVGGEIYNSTSWLTGARGNSAMAVGVGGLASTAAPAIGLGMLGNTMFGPGAGMIGLAAGAVLGIGNRALTVANSQESLNERALAYGQSGVLGKFAMNGLDIGGGIGWLISGEDKKAQASAFASVADSYEKFMTDNPTVDISQYDSIAKNNVVSMLKSSGQFGTKRAKYEYVNSLDGAIERLGFSAEMNERGLYQSTPDAPPELVRYVAQTRANQLKSLPDFADRMKTDDVFRQTYKDFTDIDRYLEMDGVKPMSQDEVNSYNGSIENLAESVFEGAKYRAFTTVQGNSGIGIEQASANYALSKQIGTSANGMNQQYIDMDAITRSSGYDVAQVARSMSGSKGELFSQSGLKNIGTVIAKAFDDTLGKTMFERLERVTRDIEMTGKFEGEYTKFRTGGASDSQLEYKDSRYSADMSSYQIAAAENTRLERFASSSGDLARISTRSNMFNFEAGEKFKDGNFLAGFNLMGRASALKTAYSNMLQGTKFSASNAEDYSRGIEGYVYKGLDPNDQNYNATATERRRDVSNVMSRDPFTQSINYNNGVYNQLDGTKGTGSGGSSINYASIAFNKVDTGKFAGTGAFQYEIDGREKAGLVSAMRRAGFGTEAHQLARTNVQGGTYGLQRQMANLQYDSQIAGLGIQAASARMGFAFMTGGSTQLDSQGFVVGGDVGKAVNRAGFNPGNGMGFWQVQDRMTQIGRERQDWQMMRQGQNLDLGMRDKELQIRQFGEKWNFNWDWMKTSNAHQRREMNISRRQQLVQRDWQREDMATNRNQSQLGFAWQQEDFDRNIRFARGRERVDMMREKSRSVIQFSIEQSKMDKDENRFKETSKWEDKRFEREKEFFEKTVEHGEEEMKMEKRHFEERMALDDERMKMAFEDFEMEKKWIAETRAMEDQQRLLERQQQVYNFQYQMASIGLSIATATEMKRLEDTANNLNLGQSLLDGLSGWFTYMDIDVPLIIENLGTAVVLFQEAVKNARIEVDQMYTKGGRSNGDDYATGGYTGHGGKFEVAGTVHKGEYVIPQEGVPVIRGSDSESSELLSKIATLLEKILRKREASVNAVIYTNQSSMKQGELVDLVYRRNRK